MNYHALAPKRCKRSIVSGFVYRIYHACSNWKNFHDSLERAKRVLEWNQYPPTFWMKPVSSNLSRANHKTGIERFTKQPPTSPSQKTTEVEKVQLRIQYHGKCSEEYVKALHKIEAPCMVVMTLRKLKTVLPSLKPPVEKLLRSGVVYQLMCPSCSACYVGMTCRHLQTRLKEHIQRSGPVKSHIIQCRSTITEEYVEILQTSSRGEVHLLTLEALNIREKKPAINTKDEYRSRELIIKL